MKWNSAMLLCINHIAHEYGRRNESLIAFITFLLRAPYDSIETDLLEQIALHTIKSVCNVIQCKERLL